MGPVKKTLCAVGGVAVLFFGIALFLPGEVRVERSIVVRAPLGIAFNLVEDLEKHALWTPWGTEEPAPRILFGEIRQGRGASYFWIGGHGSHGMFTVASVTPPHEVTVLLDLASLGDARGVFTFAAAGEGTEVREVFRKDLGYNLPARYLRPLYRARAEALLDGGLQRLKRAAESAAAP